MKKFMLGAAAILAVASISLSSCGKNPADKAIDIINNATEQVKQAKSAEELQEISANMASEMAKLAKDNKDFEGTEAQEEAVKKAGEAFTQACMEAAEKFGL